MIHNKAISLKKSIINQKKTIPFIFIIYLLPFVLLASIYSLCVSTDYTVDMFTRDPAAIAGINPFLGFVSSAGVILWTISAAVSIFTGVVIYKQIDKRDCSFFLILSGLLTLLLLLDDYFELHEITYKLFFKVEEIYIFAFYGLFLAFILLRYRKTVFKSKYLILVSSILFFGLSFVFDLYQHDWNLLIGVELRILFEDGFKLFGIMGWCCYFCCCSYLALKNPKCD